MHREVVYMLKGIQSEATRRCARMVGFFSTKGAIRRLTGLAVDGCVEVRLRRGQFLKKFGE